MGGASFPIFFRLAAFPVADANNNCDFSILTTLSSPRPETLVRLNVGDILTIRESETRALYALTSGGELCGTILSNIRKIITCMAKGISFEGKILLLNGAECQILIQKSKAA